MQTPPILDNDATVGRYRTQWSTGKRAYSSSPDTQKSSTPQKPRRCQSLSPSTRISKMSVERQIFTQETPSAPGTINLINYSSKLQVSDQDKEIVVPHCVMVKMMRSLSTKKREFMKLRKNLIIQQNILLEHFASLKNMESRAGVVEDNMGEVRVLSVSTWPAHDILLLIRDDFKMPMNSKISGQFGTEMFISGSQVHQQLIAELIPIPEEVFALGAEMMARRMELVNLLRIKHRTDRTTYITNLEWRTKNTELDNDTEKLHGFVAKIAEKLKAKINYSLELAQVPWLDRECMVKQIECLQKENMILQQKTDGMIKKEQNESRESYQLLENRSSYQVLCKELAKERVAREALKEVVSSAENMLRVARARITVLERQIKDGRSELDAAKKKYRDLEQLYRQRETSYDTRSKKLLEVSKTGESTIETLSRQRDALELRVKELHELAEAAERAAGARQAEQRTCIASLQAKVAKQEENKSSTEFEMEARVNELEEQLQALREKSARLVDMERRRCLEYVPSKESEPSDRETEIWKELQVTRGALSRAEEELRQSRADKDSFLDSLSRIAQGEGVENFQDKMATELLEREQKIVKLRNIIRDLKKNENQMEQSMSQYENQLAVLRLEVQRLRVYDCYSKEIPYPELQVELLETQMQVEALSHERTTLISAAASRTLMLERHERAADLFARMIRARRDLAALLEGGTEPSTQPIDEVAHAEASRSLTSMCANAANTWTALRAERARVIRLESAVLAQGLQLEREGWLRTQLERRRAMLEREVLRAKQKGASMPDKSNPSLIF